MEKSSNKKSANTWDTGDALQFYQRVLLHLQTQE